MLEPEEVKTLFAETKNRTIDETDFNIICLLEHQGEKSLKEIAEHVGLTPASVSTRLKRLKKEGIFVKYVPLTRIEKIGFARDLILLIQTEPGSNITEISENIASIRGVKSLYKLIGEYDLYVQLCCQGDIDLENTLTALNEIQGIIKVSKTLIQQRLKENFHNLVSY